MNLANASRSRLSKIPGLNKALDVIIGRANEVFTVEHNPETGEHADVTFRLGSAVSWAVGAGVYMAASAERRIANTEGAYDLRVGDPESNYFAWDGAARTLIVNGSGTFTGSIIATSGAIGGWLITATALTDAAGAVGMSSAVTGADDIRFWAGNATPGSAPYRVTEAGALVASNATITGSITATTGTIGGWTIGATTLTGGDAVLASSGNLTLGTSNNVVRISADDATYRLWVGHATAGSAPFRVEKDGSVIATDVSLTAGLTVLDSSGLTLGSSAGNSSYVTSSALKFVRPSAYLYGQTGDHYGVFAIANGTDEDIYFENTIKGTAAGSGGANGKAGAVLLAQGWDSTGAGSSTTATSVVVRSEIGVSRVTISATDTIVSGTLSVGSTLQTAATIQQASGQVVYPGTVSGLGSYQTSYYLASHASYGLYSNTGLGLSGNLVMISANVYTDSVYSFAADTDTYFTRYAADSLAFVVGGVQVLNIPASGHLQPAVDNTWSLGVNGKRFSEVWATNGTIQTSDATVKADIQDADLGAGFLMALRPKSWVWAEGTDTRRHYGFTSQDVAAALGPKADGFGGLYRKDGTPDGLNYSVFIAPLVAGFQDLASRLASLEAGRP